MTKLPIHLSEGLGLLPASRHITNLVLKQGVAPKKHSINISLMELNEGNPVQRKKAVSKSDFLKVKKIHWLLGTVSRWIICRLIHKDNLKMNFSLSMMVLRVAENNTLVENKSRSEARLPTIQHSAHFMLSECGVKGQMGQNVFFALSLHLAFSILTL